MFTKRILLIDDHAMFRSGLRMLLGVSLPTAEVHEAGSVNEAIHDAAAKPDVVLLDIQLPGLNGVDGIALLERRWPGVPVLMLSSQDEPEMVRRALARGAAGFVSKAETAERIVEAINQALRGQLAPQPTESLDTEGRQLTPRQREVLDLLWQGLSNKLIARRLGLSDNTVRRHVQDILEYFQVASRTEAVCAAHSRGLVN